MTRRRSPETRALRLARRLAKAGLPVTRIKVDVTGDFVVECAASAPEAEADPAAAGLARLSEKMGWAG